jgi:hypothetical protein
MPAGFGKTWYMGQLVKANWMHGRRSLVVTLEMPALQWAQRMHQSFFAIGKRKERYRRTGFELDEKGRFVAFERKTIRSRPSFEDTDIRSRLAKKLKSIEKRPPILIREFPTGSLSVKQLEAFLDMLEHRERFIPDLLVIDYADLMTLPNLDGDLRVKHGELHKQIRGIAGSRNIAVVSAVQANREGLKVSTVTEANIAEDYSKVGTVDTLITGSQTQSEKDLGLMRLFVAKGRDDVSKFQILLSQMYPIGQFVVESTMLNNAYWQVLRGDDEDD